MEDRSGLTDAPLDWSRPWLAPYRTVGEPVWRLLASEPVASALQAAPRPAGPEFVAQQPLPPGLAYETFVFATQRVPTRDNLHDFFNGLVWLHFPESKRRLNALQAAEIARAGTGPSRGPVRDAITLFDENGALLDAPPALWQALLDRDWQALFVQRRHLWREARLLVFGHAALEKLVYPRKAITVHVYRAQLAMDSIATLDTALAASLSAEPLAGKPFVPLPVLGVPGWNAQNEEVCFYDDSCVFRPRSAVQKRSTTKAPPAAGIP